MSRPFRTFGIVCSACGGRGCDRREAPECERGIVQKLAHEITAKELDEDKLENPDDLEQVRLEQSAEWACDPETKDNGYVADSGEVFDLNGDEARVLAAWTKSQKEVA